MKLFREGCAVFVLAFGLYAAFMPPALAPYRDTGEMSLACRTLGVAHPTSYPLYVLLGHLTQGLPLGNAAYRLNLLSALCGALALAWLFALCRRRWGFAAGLAAVLLLGANATFWSVVQVQEMYALLVLCAVLLMGLAWSLEEGYGERSWLFFAFAFGLCLSNRLDLILWAPGLLWMSLGPKADRRAASLWAGLAFLVFPALMEGLGSNLPIAALIAGTAVWLAPAPRARWVWRSALFAGLGLAVYLYLPVRSRGAPFLDWNHPAVLSNFLDSLLRTRYGGTLDLLSKNYAKGELFGANMAVYGGHLWENFWAVGLAAALAGCWLCLRREPRRWLGMAAAWWWSGPVFLLMANMPPNPHAAAIVEPHYLLSDLVLVFWAAEGVGSLASLPAASPLAWAACALLAAAPVWRGRLVQMDRRGHLFSYDYAKNVMRCALPGGTVVAKKDVQLYTLWHYRIVQGWRADLRVVAQGLSGTPWYQADQRRAFGGLFVGPLRDGPEWRRFIGLDAPVFATMDCEVPPEVAGTGRARGLLISWAAAAAQEERSLWQLMVRRGRYEYEGQPDFFTSDLVASYSLGVFQLGRRLLEGGLHEDAAACFLRAWSWQWSFPDPASFLGFMAFQRGDFPRARDYYALAVQLNQDAIRLTQEYHSLPDLKANIRKATAEALLQLGVVSQRLGEPAAAESCYRASLDLAPSAQARYDLAVLYWGSDRARAEAELVEALRLDPGHAEANRYLAILRSGGRRP